jgi:hypothetical protein
VSSIALFAVSVTGPTKSKGLAEAEPAAIANIMDIIPATAKIVAKRLKRYLLL